jgi:putative flippase GtrA
MEKRPADTAGATAHRPVGAGHARPAFPRFAALAAHFPPGQFLRYLVVGAWNTLFGYSLYAALTALLTPLIPYSYMVASLLANVVGITVAFLGYKWFVFKTKGNYLREWTRCVVVYSGAIAVGLLLLPILVAIVRHYTRYQRQAPYIAGAMLTGVSVVFGFVGHRKFSFRPRP